MAVRGLPFKLNRDLPFVAATMEAAADSALLTEAANVLREIEERHGLEILHHSHDDCVLPCGVFRPTDRRLSYSELIPVLRDQSEFEVHFQLADDNGLDFAYEFLTETQLIVRGINFTNDHFFRTSAGIIHAWSMRGWGYELAGWANATDWAPHYNRQGHKYSWKYGSFYTDLCDQAVHGYFTWEDSVLAVIKRKCELQLQAV